MKYLRQNYFVRQPKVALFTRAWIEISKNKIQGVAMEVALFTRAWIEIIRAKDGSQTTAVALFTRAWIEMAAISQLGTTKSSRTLHEGVD